MNGGTRMSVVAAVALLCVGYLIVVRPFEVRTADRYAELARARADLERSTALARSLPALQNERRQLETQLRAAHLHDGRPAVIERFLRAVADVAERDGVAVQTVANAAHGPLNAAAVAATPGPFEELPFDLTVRGRYGAVLDAVRHLDAAVVAARITPAALSGADGGRGGAPLVSATFHVTLLREADEPTRAPGRR